MTPELQKYAERFLVAVERIADALENGGTTAGARGHKYLTQEPTDARPQARTIRPRQASRS